MSFIRRTSFIGVIDRTSDFETLVDDGIRVGGNYLDMGSPGLYVSRIATYAGQRDIIGVRGPFTISVTVLSSMITVPVLVPDTDPVEYLYLPLKKCLELTWWKLSKPNPENTNYIFNKALGSTATGFPGPQYNGNVETDGIKGPVFLDYAHQWKIGDTRKSTMNTGYVTKLFYTFAKYTQFSREDLGQYAARVVWLGHNSSGAVITDANKIPENTVNPDHPELLFLKPTGAVNSVNGGFIQILKGESGIPSDSYVEWVEIGG